jgi:hypothetical protein
VTPEPRARYIAAPLVVVLAAYASALTGGFVWDDYDLILENPLIAGGARLRDFFLQPFWSNPLVESRAFYRPLVTLSYALDHRIWGSSAFGYHATNLLLHLGCTLLVVLLCRRAGARWPVASLLGCLFGLFPRLTESVAWVSGRTDPAATLFALAALLAWVPGPGRWPRKIAAALLLLLGLLCKEVAIAAFVALVAWELAVERRPRALVHVSPLVVAVLAYIGLRSVALSGHVRHWPTRSIGQAAISMTEAVGRYALMLLDPLRPRLQIGSLSHPNLVIAAVGAIVLAGSCVLVWTRRRRFQAHGWLALALGATALALVLHVVRLDLNVVAADRFLYLPLAALAIGVAAQLEAARTHRPAVTWAAGVALVATFAVATAMRTRLWTDELALWRAAAREQPPGPAIAQVELAQVLMSRDRYHEALAILDGVSGEARGTVPVRHNQAVCWDKLGRHDESIAALESLVREFPERRRLRVTLMLVYARALRFDDARRVARELDTPDAPAPLREMIAVIDELARTWPTLADDAGRARAYERLGAVAEAGRLWRAIALDRAAPVELRAHAAGYLALHADADPAREVLDALAREGFRGADVSQLKAIVDARFEG